MPGDIPYCMRYKTSTCNICGCLHLKTQMMSPTTYNIKIHGKFRFLVPILIVGSKPVRFFREIMGIFYIFLLRLKNTSHISSLCDLLLYMLAFLGLFEKPSSNQTQSLSCTSLKTHSVRLFR